jgi:hypothetical protein
MAGQLIKQHLRKTVSARLSVVFNEVWYQSYLKARDKCSGMSNPEAWLPEMACDASHAAIRIRMQSPPSSHAPIVSQPLTGVNISTSRRVGS